MTEQTAKAPGARCWECPFKDEPFVPSQNLFPISRIAVIGEAPGAHEATRGIPFTGPSGKLLDQVLSHHGIQRDEVLVSNICLCRPENNDDPPKSAIAACKPRLDREIAQSGVKKILAVGGTAAKALLDSSKTITNLRVGAPKPYVEDPDIEIIASWHPAYCLRSPDSFPSFVKDVAKLNGYDPPPWQEPVYKEYRQPQVILAVIKKLATLPGPFVIDIECGVDKDVSYVHPDHYEMLCIGICWEPGRAVVLGRGINEPAVKLALGDLLRKKKLIGHNGKFDLNGLYPIVGPLELWADTMLMSYVLDERPGQHGLKKLSIELLGAPDYEAEIRKFVPRGGNYADIPVDVLHKYNAYDVVCTWALYERFFAEMGDREHRVHDFLIKASNAVMHLERAGITIDLDYNDELASQFIAELDLLETEICETVGQKLNPRSPQQITRYMADQGYMFETTEADFLVEVLPKLDGNVATFIELLLKHRRLAKLYGTYVKGFRKREYQGKIYTTYSLHGTTSGRLASKNPNLQNVKRDKRIKRQFTVEKEDHVLVHCDYKQAEGRVITTLAQDDYLASIFRDPTRDIFDELCNDTYGKGNWTQEDRVKMKSVFYGNAYGRGINAIAVELNISTEEARTIIGNFKSLAHATVSWQASVTHQVLSGQDLITKFGRKRSFWLITEQNKSDVVNEALSYLPQSTASDICVSALIELQPRLRDLATPRLTIHDALIAECKEQDQDEVAGLMVDTMVAAGLRFTDYVPFAVDTKFGKAWSEL